MFRGYKSKVFKGKAEVRTFFKHRYSSGSPYVGWLLKLEEEDGMEIEMRFKQTQHAGLARILSLIVKPKSLDILIERALGGMVETALWRRDTPAERAMMDMTRRVVSIPFSEPDFQDRFHKLLEEVIPKTPFGR